MEQGKGVHKSKVTISILTHNRCLILKDLLRSLRRLSYQPLEIIVVDNCSQDETEGIVREDDLSATYIKNKENTGAAARNLGFMAATGEIVITLDDDISGITDKDVARLVEMFGFDPLLGVVNFKVLDRLSGEVCNWVHHRDKEEWSDKEFITYEITEGASAFRKEVLGRSGYYAEEFFLSHEGPDLAFRIIDNGFKVIYSGKISVEHAHSNLGRRGWINYYYDTRNILWVAVRNLPLYYGAKYLFRGLAAMFFYSIRDGYIKYYALALKDGIQGLKPMLRKRKVLNKNAMRQIREIDLHRPPLMLLIKERIFKKNIRF